MGLVCHIFWTPCKIACFFVDWNEGIQVSFILPFRFSVWQWAQLLPAPPVVREPRIPCWRTWEGWWRRHNWTRCHQKRSNNWRRSLKLEVSWVSWVFSSEFLRRILPNPWILGEWVQGKSSFQEFDQEIKQDAAELVQPQQILEAERKSKDVPSNLGVKVDRDPILKWWSPMNLLAEHHNAHLFLKVLCPWLISGVWPPTLHRWGFVAVVSAKMTQVCVGLDFSFFGVVSVGNLVIQPCCRRHCWSQKSVKQNTFWGGKCWENSAPATPDLKRHRWWPSWSLKKGSMSPRRVNFPTLEMGEKVSSCRLCNVLKANFLAFLGHQNRKWLFSSWHCYIF